MYPSIKSRTFKALVPALWGRITVQLNPSIFSVSPTKSIFRATPITLYGTPSTPLPLPFPTPTIPVQSGANNMALLWTIFVGSLLFSSVLVGLPCVMLSLPALSIRLRRLIPFIGQIVLVIVLFGLLHIWPSLLEYPIEEIWNVGSKIWKDLPDMESPHDGFEMRSSRRVAIVLERRSDKSLWVAELKQPAFSEDVHMDRAIYGSQEFTSGTSAPLDLADVKAKFTSARDWVPSAPWRILGYHIDPLELSTSPSLRHTDGKDGPVLYPLDQEHASERFSYSRSHDISREMGSAYFWDSSAHGQVLAWSLVEFQSCTSFWGNSSRNRGDFYNQFGIEPFIADLKLAIISEEQERKHMSEDWARQMCEKREKDRLHLEEEAERRKEANRRWERNFALQGLSIKSRGRRIGPGPGWKDPGRLRPRRNLPSS